jgi:chemotaxis-related protein WspB
MLILTFTAGGNCYGVDVAQVVELVPRVELRTIPHAPGFLAGFLGYRGQVVPVIDLGLLLGAGPCPDRLSTRIILVKPEPGNHNQTEEDRAGPLGEPGPPRLDENSGRGLLGLIAEQVGDLFRVPPENVVPAPVSLPQTPYLDTIAQTDQGFVPLIGIPKLSLILRSQADREATSENPEISNTRADQNPGHSAIQPMTNDS